MLTVSENAAKMRTANSEQPNSVLKILVCYHKPYTIPPLDNGVFIPIHVGKALSNIILDMQTDSQVNDQPCDNISKKNDTYCELTAMYWAWKNLRKLYPDVKYIGLFHYRRFLAFRKLPLASAETRPERDIASYRIKPQEIIRTLEAGKIIVPSRMNFPYSVATQYCVCCMSEDYRHTKEVIRTKFPDYYRDFVHVMEHSNKGTFCNMFVMKYDDFVKYCEWLFAVLAEVEPLVPYHYYSTQQRRVFGFIAERLFNVYIRKNKLQAVYSSVYYYGGEERKSTLKNLCRNLHHKLHSFKNGLAFSIQNTSAQSLIKKFLPSS